MSNRIKQAIILIILFACLISCVSAYTLDMENAPQSNRQSNTINSLSTYINPLNNNVSNLTYQKVTMPDPWGYGYFIHPSVIYSSTKIFNHPYWEAVTPYPYIDQASSVDQKMETPCLYYSDNGLTFKTAPGVKNPFAGINPVGYSQNAYGSDPEIVYNPDTKQMFCYYVIGDIVGNKTIEDTKVRVYNGKTMSKEYSCTGIYGVSPTVIYDQKSKKFYLWIIDISGTTHKLVRYESKNGINYTNKKILDISQIYRELWHIDVSYNQYDKTYYMITTFSGMNDLWLASAKNITDAFVLYQRDPTIYCNNISDSSSGTIYTYRSSGVFKNANTLELWVSAQRTTDKMWHVVHVTAKRNGYDWKYVK